MNIYPVNDNSNISMRGKTSDWFKRVGQKIFDTIPGHTTKEGKNTLKDMDKFTYWVSDPMWNRGIMGATALLTQPTIDYYNHRVDDETRTVSRNRTIAKIVAGTLVGMFVVRGPVYKFVEKTTNPNGSSKFAKSLLPEKFIKELAKNQTHLKNYRATIAMIIALAAMSITNFVLDAPLTIILTNLLNKKSGVRNSDDNLISTKNEMEVNDA